MRVAFFQTLLRILDVSMETPQLYGWFHLLFLALSFALAVPLCRNADTHSDRQVRRVVWVTALVVAILEVYKQINYSFSYENGITFDYQWYAFPFQFCSTPMYVGLLAGIIKKGRVHESLCAYLATYAVFAGLSVMVYPVSVFVSTVGINIQTMICHGSMITVGIYLFASGYVPMKWKTLWKALPVFAINLALAVGMNEIAHATGLLERETFNMFFVSPYCEPSLPVYSLVQQAVAYPWCLALYIMGFTAAAGIVLLLAKGCKQILTSAKRKKAAV